MLVRGPVGDPLQAVDDLAAATQGPVWVAAVAGPEHALAEQQAARSRVRTARVGPSPELTGAHRSAVAPPEEPMPADGAEPVTWAVLRPLLLG